jgi:hemolysin III
LKKPVHPASVQTLGEEISNSVSHGIGFAGAVAITPFILLKAIDRGAGAIVSASIFCATMVILYLASTLYHAFPQSRTKNVFQVFDHGAIFLLIAGTYTPFTLGILPPAWGWPVFGVVWALAILGIILKSTKGASSGKLSTALYVAMGWLAVAAAKPLYENLPPWGLFWLLAGGLMYSGGIFFFIAERIRYSHFIWHIFVLAGTVCHVVAVYCYVY